jgi:hypothetical protein
MFIRYLRGLTTPKIILWCYLIWYVVVLIRYFDPNPRIWLTSLGLSGIVGYALYLSATATNRGSVRLERWQTIRLFMMPFCVSSFSALVKGRDFFLIFSPRSSDTITALTFCAVFCAAVFALKKIRWPAASTRSSVR